jgi:hypothetical protein
MSTTQSAVKPEIDQSRMLEKVRALLAKAEASTYAEEAEAFSAKAQELMARYSIERALVEGITNSGDAERVEISIDNPYAKAKFTLLDAVASPNRCQAIYRSSTKTGFVVGFRGDLETVELLYTSLLLQATGLMTSSGPSIDPWGTNRTKSFRNAFLQGFAHSIGSRFEENRRMAEAEAATEAGTNALPVLAERQSVVDNKMHELFPSLGTLRTSMSNGAGVHAGMRAGATADIGSSRLAGTRGELGR